MNEFFYFEDKSFTYICIFEFMSEDLIRVSLEIGVFLSRCWYKTIKYAFLQWYYADCVQSQARPSKKLKALAPAAVARGILIQEITKKPRDQPDKVGCVC